MRTLVQVKYELRNGVNVKTDLDDAAFLEVGVGCGLQLVPMDLQTRDRQLNGPTLEPAYDLISHPVWPAVPHPTHPPIPNHLQSLYFCTS